MMVIPVMIIWSPVTVTMVPRNSYITGRKANRDKRQDYQHFVLFQQVFHFYQFLLHRI